MIKDNYIYKKIGYILNKNIKRIRFTDLEIILSILTSALKTERSNRSNLSPIQSSLVF